MATSSKTPAARLHALCHTQHAACRASFHHASIAVSKSQHGNEQSQHVQALLAQDAAKTYVSRRRASIPKTDSGTVGWVDTSFQVQPPEHRLTAQTLRALWTYRFGNVAGQLGLHATRR
eukprot:363913-Chlamydomonas_euryale.AAC.7